jgi:hypothetical protein
MHSLSRITVTGTGNVQHGDYVNAAAPETVFRM